MPSTADLRYSFNRGEIGKTSLARVDRDALRLAAEVQENWMPLQQGPMMVRPGTAYLGSTRNNARARLIPFVFSLDDTALLEFTTSRMRVWVDDELVTRPSVTTAVKSGTFSSASGWALKATSGSTATISGGVLTLAATARGSKTSATQTVNVPSGSRNVEHALRVVVTTGPIYFKVGSLPGDDDLVKRTALGTGQHSLAFTPGSAFTITFENTERAERVVTSCSIESSGVLEIPTVWSTSELSSMQYASSGDVVFIACNGNPPKKIERRSTTSWSVVDYLPNLGPVRLQNNSEKEISLRSTVYEGNGRLVASAPLFKSKYVGSLVRMFPSGQVRKASLAGEDVWSEALRVSGVDFSRYFSVTISGTWKGTLSLQYSLDGPDAGFQDVAKGNARMGSPEYVKNGTTDLRDNGEYNNAIVWYRIGFKPGNYSSGVAVVSFGGNTATGGADVTTGGSPAYARITGIVSSTVAEMEVIKPFSGLSTTKDWLVSEWNSSDGYPSAVALFDGRLWWSGKDRVWGSVSDDYENFDYDFSGDAGPISRSFGSGPVDSISWLLPLTRLLVGRGTAVSSVRSSNFDEPLTPTNFTLKDASTRGAATLSPGMIDNRGVYLHANGRQLIEMMYRVEAQDYSPIDLTQFNLDIGLPGFTRMAVAQSPESRVFVIRSDGTLAVLLHDTDGGDMLMSWWRATTNGDYEDVAVLPGSIEDKVYVIAERSGHRYLEVFARRDECLGAPETKCLDSHIVYTGSAVTTISGLDHLEGKSVAVWGSEDATSEYGQYIGTYRVRSGSIGTFPIAVTVAVVGLPYTAKFLSAKLAYGAGMSIGQLKHIDQIAFVLFDTDAKALTYGPDLDSLDPMPLMEDGTTVPENKIWDHYDKRLGSIPGKWEADARLALQVRSPRPATVAAVILSVDTSARIN